MDFSQDEKEIYIEEVLHLLDQGYKISQIAERLQWSEADIRDLLRSDMGRAAMEASGKAAGQFNLEEADLTMAEARAYAKQRLPHYIKKLDRLVESDTSPQVRMAAAQALLKLSGAFEDQQFEIVEMPDYLVKNLVDAIVEAQS